MKASDYPENRPAFIERAPALTAERLEHAEFMRQHWYAMYRAAVAEVALLRRELEECRRQGEG